VNNLPRSHREKAEKKSKVKQTDFLTEETVQNVKRLSCRKAKVDEMEKLWEVERKMCG
jgi:hypothetical protein